MQRVNYTCEPSESIHVPIVSDFDRRHDSYAFSFVERNDSVLFNLGLGGKVWLSQENQSLDL